MAAAATTGRGKRGGNKAGKKAGKGGRRRVSASELEAKAALADSGDEDAAAVAALDDSLIAKPSELDETRPNLGDEEEEVETIDATGSDVPPPEADLADPRPGRAPIPSASASPAPPIYRSEISVIYGPDRTRHMSEMGPVCTQNWIGRVKGQRVSVRFGAPLSTIPVVVRQALSESRIKFAYAAAPRPGERKGPAEPPRARRRTRGVDGGESKKPFRTVQGLTSRP